MLRFAVGSLLGLFVAYYAVLVSPPNWPSWIPPIIWIIAFSIAAVGTYITRKSRTKGLIAFFALALLMTIVLPTAAVVGRANDLASQVRTGHSITPYELFGVPILDVSASTVTANWIGPRDQRPAIFGSKSPVSVHGLLLGTEAGTAQAGTTVLLVSKRYGPDIILMPSDLVVIEGG